MQLYTAVARARPMPPLSLFLPAQAQTGQLVRPAIVAGICCIFLRLWSLSRVTGSAFINFPDGDPRYYLDWALRISQGTWTDGQAFFGLPLYPYWLALLFTIFGKGVYIPLVIQCIADAFLAAIITSLSFVILANDGGKNSNIEKTDPVRGLNLAWWLAVGAGVGWAFYQPAQAYAVTLMPTTIAALCFWLVVRWVVRMNSVPTAGRAGVVGVGLGIVATLVANILILVPLIVLRFGLLGGLTARRWISVGGASLLLLMGIVVGTSPCWIHNYFIAKEPVVFCDYYAA
jgi:hypothetical protein